MHQASPIMLSPKPLDVEAIAPSFYQERGRSHPVAVQEMRFESEIVAIRLDQATQRGLWRRWSRHSWATDQFASAERTRPVLFRRSHVCRPVLCRSHQTRRKTGRKIVFAHNRTERAVASSSPPDSFLPAHHNERPKRVARATPQLLQQMKFFHFPAALTKECDAAARSRWLATRPRECVLRLTGGPLLGLAMLAPNFQEISAV